MSPSPLSIRVGAKVRVPLPASLREALEALIGAHTAYVATDALWLVVDADGGPPTTLWWARPAANSWHVAYEGPSREDAEALCGELRLELARRVTSRLISATRLALARPERLCAARAGDLRALAALRCADDARAPEALRFLKRVAADEPTLPRFADIAASSAATLDAQGNPTVLAIRAVALGLTGLPHEAHACLRALEGLPTADADAAGRFLHLGYEAVSDLTRAEHHAVATAATMLRDQAATQVARIAWDRANRDDVSATREAAERALRWAAPTDDAYVTAGEALARAGAYAEATAALERASAHGVERATIGLATLALYRGDTAEARRLARGDAEHARRIRVLCDAVDDQDGAVDALRSWLSSAPHDAEARLWLAQRLAERGAMRDALGEIDRASQRAAYPAAGPLEVWIRVRAGEPLLQQVAEPGNSDNVHDGLLDVALPAWIGDDAARAARTSNDVLGATMRGLLDDMAGNRSEFATRRVAGRLERLPPAPGSRTASAEAVKLVRTGEPARALAALSDLAQQFPTSVHPHCYGGEVLLWLGRYDDALASFDRALAIAPARWAYVGQAAVHALRGEATLAESRWAACDAKFEPVRGATTHVYRGELRRRQGRYDEAEAALRQALAAKPSRHAARLDLALTLLATGRPEEAAQRWGEVAAALPDLCTRAIRTVGGEAATPHESQAGVNGVWPEAAERALEMMQGNRSSHIVTYVADGAFRVAPRPGEWARAARQALDLLEAEVWARIGQIPQ